MPIRTCIGCRGKFPPTDLVRISLNCQGNVSFHIKEGRGAYFCSNIECIRKACQQKKLEYAFRRKISKTAIESLNLEIQKIKL